LFIQLMPIKANSLGLRISGATNHQEANR
jgi:hypothetical protein